MYVNIVPKRYFKTTNTENIPAVFQIYNAYSVDSFCYVWSYLVYILLVNFVSNNKLYANIFKCVMFVTFIYVDEYYNILVIIIVVAVVAVVAEWNCSFAVIILTW